MSARDLARHQQCFHRCRAGARDHYQRCHHPHDSQRLTSTPIFTHDLNQYTLMATT
jgi:hypothetical protein